MKLDTDNVLRSFSAAFWDDLPSQRRVGDVENFLRQRWHTKLATRGCLRGTGDDCAVNKGPLNAAANANKRGCILGECRVYGCSSLAAGEGATYGPASSDTLQMCRPRVVLVIGQETHGQWQNQAVNQKPSFAVSRCHVWRRARRPRQMIPTPASLSRCHGLPPQAPLDDWRPTCS